MGVAQRKVSGFGETGFGIMEVLDGFTVILNFTGSSFGAVGFGV